MTVDEQIAAISVRQFYTDLRIKLGTILTSLQTEGCAVEGALVTTVGTILIRAELSGTNVHLSVGRNASGEPIYQWIAPISWVTT